jgi:hypothetical protein
MPVSSERHGGPYKIQKKVFGIPRSYSHRTTEPDSVIGDTYLVRAPLD